MSEPKQIEVGQQPFTTTDRKLALALLTAGCDWAEAKDGGPVQMHYTPEVCRNRWVTVRQSDGQKVHVTLLKQVTGDHTGDPPEEFEKAVMRAVRLKIPGINTYYILRNEVFREAMAMHDKLAAEAHNAAQEGRPTVFPAFGTLKEAEAIMFTCYLYRMNENDVDSYAWLRSPNLAMGDVKKTVTPIRDVPGSVLEQVSYSCTGGGKIWSLDLSNERRATPDKDGKPFLHPKPVLL